MDTSICVECDQDTFTEDSRCSKCRSNLNNPLGLLNNDVVSTEVLSYLWFCVTRRKCGLFIGDSEEGRRNVMNQILRFAPSGSEIASVETEAYLQFRRNEWDQNYPQRGQIHKTVRDMSTDPPDYLLVNPLIESERTPKYFLSMALVFDHCGSYAVAEEDTVDGTTEKIQNTDENIPSIMINQLDFICVVNNTEELYQVDAVYGLPDIEKDEIQEPKIEKVFSYDGLQNDAYLSGVLENYPHQMEEMETVVEAAAKRRNGLTEFLDFRRSCYRS